MATAMVEDSSFEDDQLASMTTEEIVRASRLLDNEIRILKVSLSLSYTLLHIYVRKERVRVFIRGCGDFISFVFVCVYVSLLFLYLYDWFLEKKLQFFFILLWIISVSL
jgi:hypothetical protein